MLYNEFKLNNVFILFYYLAVLNRLYVQIRSEKYTVFFGIITVSEGAERERERKGESGYVHIIL